MTRSEKAELTVLCMAYDGNKLLLQDRVKEDWKGFTFPGGHVEKEESIVHAVIREMKEETGLTVKNPKLCGVKQFQTDSGERYIVFLFKTNRFEGNLESSEEGRMEWVERGSLQNYPLVDDFMELLQVMDSEDLNEFVYERSPENGDWKVKLY